jgi:hypothetical protein
LHTPCQWPRCGRVAVYPAPVVHATLQASASGWSWRFSGRGFVYDPVAVTHHAEEDRCPPRWERHRIDQPVEHGLAKSHVRLTRWRECSGRHGPRRPGSPREDLSFRRGWTRHGFRAATGRGSTAEADQAMQQPTCGSWPQASTRQPAVRNTNILAKCDDLATQRVLRHCGRSRFHSAQGRASPD